MVKFARTLIRPATIALVGIHLLEDVFLITIGGVDALPRWSRFAIAIPVSWLLFGVILSRYGGRHG